MARDREPQHIGTEGDVDLVAVGGLALAAGAVGYAVGARQQTDIDAHREREMSSLER
ncbi:hypothetical protein M427DRAFT_32922 [Gonapodya prolifera JEL478]|uniref:Uncharacterized protein n=1 Tax=Gonapodya prolifera (strain JEL478) TaxID=1344416 RepID=A0A139AE50_GONPJ|nr:hypothetical protein M427DRAFT_32922 [Gonapodya prolifera JEL478]|eukprot:KXS14715.1 hypothetical protein M427DRAFT_32922 [Gonapodya prolifera JEL478]